MDEDSATAGIEKMIITATTSIAQANKGMRASVIPGARVLRMVQTSTTAAASADDFGEGDHLRPDVGALAGRELRARQRRIGEPADVRPDVEQERDPQQQPAEQVHEVAEGVEAREAVERVPSISGMMKTATPSITGTANRNIIVEPCMVNSSL